MGVKIGHTTYDFDESLETSKRVRAVRDLAALATLFPAATQITMTSEEEDRYRGVDYWVWWDVLDRDGWQSKQMGVHQPDRPRWMNQRDPELALELELRYPNRTKLGWAIAPKKPLVHGYLFAWLPDDWPYVYGIQADAFHAAVKSGLPLWRQQTKEKKLKELWVPTRQGSVLWHTKFAFARLSEIQMAMGLPDVIGAGTPGSLFTMGRVPEQLSEQPEDGPNDYPFDDYPFDDFPFGEGA